jgi:hypothetical protein
MMRKFFAASCLGGVLIIGAAAPAYAGTGNPSGRAAQPVLPGH